MKIQNVKETQELRKKAIISNRVDGILEVIIHKITESAKKGDSSVIMSGARYCTSDDDIALKIACDKLIESGYNVNAHEGSEAESTCFGVGYVSVTGIKISW